MQDAKQWFVKYLLLGGAAITMTMIIAPHASAAPYPASSVIGQPDLTHGAINETGLSTYTTNGLAVDSARHRLFAIDAANARILVFNLDTNDQLVDRTADFVIGQASFTTKANDSCSAPRVAANNLCFGSASNLVIDPDGNRLYVSDAINYRVLEFDISTITNNENAIAVLGQPDFTSSGSSLASASRFGGPGGVAIDAVHHKLFVADHQFNRILVFNLDSNNDPIDTTADAILGQSSFTDSFPQTLAANALKTPGSLAIDSTGNRLVVGDNGNRRILFFDITTVVNNENATSVLRAPDFDTIGTCADINPNSICEPDLEFDSTNHRLFVSSVLDYRVAMFNLTSNNDPVDANVDAVLGQPNVSTGAACSNATQNSICTPAGVTVSANGQVLFATDGLANRILTFDAASITNNENATDVIGQTDGSENELFTTKDANNGSPTAKRLKNPSDTVLDSTNHRLFVGDAGRNRILVYNLDTSNNLIDDTADAVLGQSDFTSGSVTSPTANTLACGGYCGLAFDSTHNLLFVSDQNYNRILVFNVESISNGEAAVNVIGQPDFTTASCATTQNQICSPTGGLAYDTANQRLFVPEANASRILVFSVASITNSMNAAYVIGQDNFTGSATGTSATRMSLDYIGIALDVATQRLFVSDNGNSRVLVFDVDPGVMTNGMAASYVLGQSDFTNNSAATTASGLDSPQGLGWDPVRGQLFVHDYSNDRIMIFDAATVIDGEDAMAVIGVPDFTTAGNSNDDPSATTFDPDSINMTVDPVNRRIYFPDTLFNRVLVYELAHITTSSLTGGTVSSAYSATVSVAGAQGAYSFGIAAGTLPPGIALNASTGELSGTPTAAGTYNFTVSTTNSQGAIGTVSDSRALALTVSGSSGGGSDPVSGGGSSEAGSDQASTTATPSSGQSSSPAVESDTSEDTQAATPSTFLLNESSEYFGSGATLDLEQGDTVSFCLADTATCPSNALHTISVKDIDSTLASVTLGFSPSNQEIILSSDAPRQIDVTNDDKSDIEVQTVKITGTVASLKFKRLGTMTTITKNDTNKENAPADSNWMASWVLPGGILLILAILALYFWKRWQRA